MLEFAPSNPLFRMPEGAFGGLSPVERHTLSSWVAAARRGGIDTAQDLGARDWPDHGAQTVIGVFKPEHLLASWLVVGRDGDWAVASCGDGMVSARQSSLADALKLVYAQRADDDVSNRRQPADRKQAGRHYRSG